MLDEISSKLLTAVKLCVHFCCAQPMCTVSAPSFAPSAAPRIKKPLMQSMSPSFLAPANLVCPLVHPPAQSPSSASSGRAGGPRVKKPLAHHSIPLISQSGEQSDGRAGSCRRTRLPCVCRHLPSCSRSRWWTPCSSPFPSANYFMFFMPCNRPVTAILPSGSWRVRVCVPLAALCILRRALSGRATILQHVSRCRG